MQCKYIPEAMTCINTIINNYEELLRQLRVAYTEETNPHDSQTDKSSKKKNKSNLSYVSKTPSK